MWYLQWSIHLLMWEVQIKVASFARLVHRCKSSRCILGHKGCLAIMAFCQDMFG